MKKKDKACIFPHMENLNIYIYEWCETKGAIWGEQRQSRGSQVWVEYSSNIHVIMKLIIFVQIFLNNFLKDTKKEFILQSYKTEGL